MPASDLTLVLGLLKDMQERLARLEDGQTVLTGIAIRLEGAVQGMTPELRGLRSQLERLAALEGATS